MYIGNYLLFVFNEQIAFMAIQFIIVFMTYEEGIVIKIFV